MLRILNNDESIGILDLGAAEFDGTNIRYRNILNMNCSVFGFEPNLEEYNKLVQRYLGNKKYNFYNSAVFDGEKHTLHVCKNPGMTSLLEPNLSCSEAYNAFGDFMKVLKRVNIDTVKLDDVQFPQTIDYIKLDTQGSELTILENGKRILEQACVIECEVEFIEQYVGQALFSEIEIFMRNNGFMFVSFLGYGSRCIKPCVINDDITNVGAQWLWSDAVFIKKIRDIDNMDVSKAKKMAVILYELYGMIDYSIYILSKIDLRLGSSLASSAMRDIPNVRVIR